MLGCRYFGKCTASLGSFAVYRQLTLGKGDICVQNRYCHHGAIEQSSSLDRVRFQWPRDNYMPSTSPYHMFPRISTPEDAKCVVSNMDNVTRKLILQELHLSEEEGEMLKGMLIV